MDGYAPADVAHSLPLLVVSGLGPSQDYAIQNGQKLEDGGLRITSDLPPVESEDAQVLLKYFKAIDAQNLAWNEREYTGRYRFKVKIVGRVHS